MYSLQYLYAPRFLFHAATRGAIDHPISANRQHVGRNTGWRVVREKTMVRIYILRDDPSNREAKLELARVLSYGGKYEPAAQLFRELLATNPNDEAAAIGLVGHLRCQKK